MHASGCTGDGAGRAGGNQASNLEPAITLVEPQALSIGQAGSSPLVVVADWNDLEAAALVGAELAEMAILSVEPGGRAWPRERAVEFVLVTLDGRDARLLAQREAAGSSERSEPITLVARVEPFGDAGLEARLLEGVRERLIDLAGVATRPRRR